MAVLNQNFTMLSGNTKNIVCAVTDKESGLLKDLTGCNIRWILQNQPTLDNIVSKSLVGGVESGIEIIAEGTFIIRLDPSDTEDLGGKYYHECEIEDADGNIFTVFAGRVNIIKTYIST